MLENPGKVPLEIIEVQSGAYLGEDDIVRFEDAYGRGEKSRPIGWTPAAGASLRTSRPSAEPDNAVEPPAVAERS